MKWTAKRGPRFMGVAQQPEPANVLVHVHPTSDTLIGGMNCNPGASPNGRDYAAYYLQQLLRFSTIK